MARTPAQRGPFGRWLTRVREERYPTQDMAREEMRRLAGISIGRSEYAQWESGSRVPKADNPKVARLYEFFGSTPEDEPQPVAADAGVISELSDLAAAIRALAQAIQDERAERLAFQRGLLEVLGGAASPSVVPEPRRRERAPQ